MLIASRIPAKECEEKEKRDKTEKNENTTPLLYLSWGNGEVSLY